ncbi:MAG: GIY-YIG nuclease family protein [Verrucomicrobia bacterium]|nr:GIY-YIG nuclease family protein [Verrucomicrobiota bacterium]
MYYVYVLVSEVDGEWYTGSTPDLKRRVIRHNNGEVTSTKNRRPLKLIYYEASPTKADSVARERYLKSGMGKRYLKNRLKVYLEGSPR